MGRRARLPRTRMGRVASLGSILPAARCSLRPVPVAARERLSLQCHNDTQQPYRRHRTRRLRPLRGCCSGRRRRAWRRRSARRPLPSLLVATRASVPLRSRHTSLRHRLGPARSFTSRALAAGKRRRALPTGDDEIRPQGAGGHRPASGRKRAARAAARVPADGSKRRLAAGTAAAAAAYAFAEGQRWRRRRRYAWWVGRAALLPEPHWRCAASLRRGDTRRDSSTR